MDATTILIVVFAIWNIIVFAMYGIDKIKAKRNKMRISEKTLILVAALMGALGALLGMLAFRHKTQHLKFKIGVPFLLLVNIAIIIALAILV